MVIQRIQTLLLLIAAILVAVFCMTPIATEAAVGVETVAVKHFISEAPVLLIVNILIAVLLVITIFMYKNLRQQMKVTLLCIVLIAASIVSSIFVLYNQWPGAEFFWFGGILLLGVSLIFALAAYRGMNKDHKLLRSMDRLR